MKDLIIVSDNAQHRAEILEQLFRLGCEWFGGGTDVRQTNSPAIAVRNNLIVLASTVERFNFMVPYDTPTLDDLKKMNSENNDSTLVKVDLIGDVEALRAIRDGKQVQYENNGEWLALDADVAIDALLCCKLRLKPRKLKIGDVEIDAPEDKPLRDGQRYWLVAMDHPELMYSSVWESAAEDHSRLEKRLIHLSRESADYHAKALIKVSGGEA